MIGQRSEYTSLMQRMFLGQIPGFDVLMLKSTLEWGYPYSNSSFGGGGGCIYRRIYVRARRSETKFPTVYPTIYLPKRQI